MAGIPLVEARRAETQTHEAGMDESRDDRRDDRELVHGYVEAIEGGVATVLLGEDLEEWCFPSTLLPADAHPECVLLIEARGRQFTVVGIDHSAPTVESRLGRDLLRRRPIVLPLPHRPHHRATTELAIDQRISRLARDLVQTRPRSA